MPWVAAEQQQQQLQQRGRFRLGRLLQLLLMGYGVYSLISNIAEALSKIKIVAKE